MPVLETIKVAFSMFSAIPMPQLEWNEKNTRYVLCAFPMVGIVIAFCEWGWWQLGTILGIQNILRGAGLCLLPVLITGGIHLDGYADTCDALASHRSQEDRQIIMKDPHLGAFAVIRLCCYFVAELALWSSVDNLRFPVLLGIFCLSRSLSGLALTLLPLRKGSGLARFFVEAADRRRARAVLAALSFLLALMLLVMREGETVLAAAAVFFVYRRMSEQKFGGLSGDLAGWFLQTTELWMLAVLVLRELVGRFL